MEVGRLLVVQSRKEEDAQRFLNDYRRPCWQWSAGVRRMMRPTMRPDEQVPGLNGTLLHPNGLSDAIDFTFCTDEVMLRCFCAFAGQCAQ